MSTRHTFSNNRQRGAALVIGLLLLLVLTILGISGMNSASVEFIMAGNDQYRSNAFQAAEAGIEQSIIVGTFNPGAVSPPVAGTVPNTTPPDNFTSSILSPLGAAPQPAIWGNSWNSFSTYHFEIQSTGTSSRNSRTTHQQGIAVIAPSSPSVTGPGGLI